VKPDYFETMRVPIVRGRGFQPADASSAAGLVAVVNEKFAETFWKGQDPIGKRVKPCCNDQPPWFTVVGVAKDVKQGGVAQETGTELYMSVQQVARSGPGLGFTPLNHVVLRTTITPAALARTIERTVREQLDPSVPVVRLRDMETVLASVKKTGKALVGSQAVKTASFTAEVADTITRRAFDWLDAPVERVGARFAPLPFAPVMEEYVVPHAADVLEAIRRTVGRA